jgi:hypothetical protein
MGDAKTKAEVLQANHELLAAVATTDYRAYEKLSAPTLTCFEAETKGHLVEGGSQTPAHSTCTIQIRAFRFHHDSPCRTASAGLSFHKYFFDAAHATRNDGKPPPKQNIIASPHVRLLGADAAVVSYVRVIQSGGDVATCQETRVWERGPDSHWRNVHFHRSSNL